MVFRRAICAAVSAALLAGISAGALPPAYNSEFTTLAADEQEVFSADDWDYVLTDGGAKIVAYTFTGNGMTNPVPTLPQKIGGHKVVSFAAGIFSGAENVYQIVVSDPTAEYDANWLAGSNVGAIYSDDFLFRFNYEKTELEVYSWRKDNRDSSSELLDVTVPESFAGYPVTSLNSYLFSRTKKLGRLTLPDSISYIGRNMFQNSSITAINIPHSVKIIENECFKGCTSLSEVILHDDLFAVSYTAFTDCPCFEDIPPEYRDEYTSASNSDDFYSVTKRYGDWVIEVEKDSRRQVVNLNKYVGKSETGVLTIPKEVGGFEINRTFLLSIFDADGSGIEEVNFEDGATIVPTLTSPTLKKVTFPDSVTNIGMALYNCTALESVVIPAGVKSLSGTFNGCTSLTDVTFEGEGVSILGGAFSNTNIKRLALPANSRLETDNLPDSLEEISFAAGDSAELSGEGKTPSKGLKRIVFSPDIKNITIGSNALRGSSIKALEIAGGSTDIGFMAFRECPALREVNISGNVKIASNAFSDCTELESVTLGGDCDIAELAFSECPKLAEVSFDLSQGLSGRVFNSCPNLLRINGIEVVPADGTEPVPEMKDYFYGKCQTAHELGFVDRFTVNNARKVVAEYTDASMSDIEKVKVLHDWVCANTVYDGDNEQYLGNHVDSCIFMDGVAVCEGYAATYDILLHEAGIESCCVDSANHAWNLVKVGGEWFHVDTTWDDGDDITYGWFLCPDSEMNTGGHAGFELGCPSYLHSLPAEQPKCTAVMGDLDGDGQLTFSDITAMRADIASGKPYTVTADLSYDGRLSSADIAVALKRLPDCGHLMGDVNGDGRVDSSDASDVLIEYSLLSVGNEASLSPEQTVAADLNADGKTDSADASVILAYFSYLSTGGKAGLESYLK